MFPHSYEDCVGHGACARNSGPRITTPMHKDITTYAHTHHTKARAHTFAHAQAYTYARITQRTHIQRPAQSRTSTRIHTYRVDGARVVVIARKIGAARGCDDGTANAVLALRLQARAPVAQNCCQGTLGLARVLGSVMLPAGGLRAFSGERIGCSDGVYWHSVACEGWSKAHLSDKRPIEKWVGTIHERIPQSVPLG